jgi:hypothetical protein
LTCCDRLPYGNGSVVTRCSGRSPTRGETAFPLSRRHLHDPRGGNLYIRDTLSPLILPPDPAERSDGIANFDELGFDRGLRPADGAHRTRDCGSARPPDALVSALSAFSRTCCRADRARRSSFTSWSRISTQSGESSRISGVPSPAVAAQELVAHGQIRVQDRANLRRARG